jgi:hypothetical protein
LGVVDLVGDQFDLVDEAVHGVAEPVDLSAQFPDFRPHHGVAFQGSHQRPILPDLEAPRRVRKKWLLAALNLPPMTYFFFRFLFRNPRRPCAVNLPLANLLPVLVPAPMPRFLGLAKIKRFMRPGSWWRL